MSIRLPDPPRDYDQRWAQDLVRILEQASVATGQPLGKGYSVSNFTPTRTLDASTATTAQIANFIATLVSDLLKSGTLGK